MTTTLIERGAIALLRKDGPQFDWDKIPDDAKEPYLESSRTCLEAFRVPTDKMADAGNEAAKSFGLMPAYTGKGPRGQEPIFRYMLRTAAYPEMIDAELETDA